MVGTILAIVGAYFFIVIPLLPVVIYIGIRLGEKILGVKHDANVSIRNIYYEMFYGIWKQ